jgi:hypothetical protein
MVWCVINWAQGQLYLCLFVPYSKRDIKPCILSHDSYCTTDSSWKWILLDTEYSYLQIITVVLNYSVIHILLDCSCLGPWSVSSQTQAVPGAVHCHWLWHANLSWFVGGHPGNAASNSTSTAVGMPIAVDTWYSLIVNSCVIFLWFQIPEVSGF